MSHQLIATLYPSDASRDPLVTAQDIDIRRYSPVDPSLTPLAPISYTLDTAVPVEFQVPRSVYRLGDLIPVYVTIPVPPTEQVLQNGMRLRNIMVELVRTTTVVSHQRPRDSDSASSSSLTASTSASEAAASDYSVISGDGAFRSTDERLALVGKEETLTHDRSVFKATITRSGAPARFHSSRPVRIRLIVRASPSPSSPVQAPIDGFSHSSGAFDCPITQYTTLHSVDFSLDVSVSFLLHRGNASVAPNQESASVSIPITLLPPIVRRPDTTGEGDMERDYYKKFDKPPVKTNREADADVGPPGPSASGAPPPFDERDVPPPPFVQSESIQAGSSRLPTFLESEAHYVVPLPGPSNSSHMPYGGYATIEASILDPPGSEDEEDPDRILETEGEGRLFGFRPEEQFDGLEASYGSGAEPPPTIEDAQADTDVTALADLVDRPDQALEAIGHEMGIGAVEQAYVDHRTDDELDQFEHALRIDPDTPAPPFMDDPADPPPGIDMEFRHSPPPFPSQRSDADLHTPPLPHAGLPPPIGGQGPPPPISDEGIVNPSVRPPPYLNSTSQPEGQHGPPPYMDLRPA